jgi:hypothetical protein
MHFQDPIERRARLITDLATLTLMVDKGLVSVEEAVERLQLIQSVMPASYQKELVTRQLDFVVRFLRSKGNAAPDSARWTPVVVQGGLSDPADDPPGSPSES